MFGHHRWERDEGCRAAPRQGRGRRFGGFPGGGWGGFGNGGEFVRVGRMLAQGDLRLLALALIAEQPRHGYEIIKLVEEKTGGWYSPSPGVVYPTLTYLEDAGYISPQSEGSRKLYAITDEGRAYLAENEDLAKAILSRLDAFAEKVAKMRRMFGGGEEGRGRPAFPPLVEAAFANLREVAAGTLDADPRTEAKVVEVLARAAGELKQG